jgi:hypothetical protein
VTTYEIRDVDLPGEPPVAVTGDYDTAMRAVVALDAAFHAQLDANGEGASALSQRLSVTAVHSSAAPQIRALSTVSGYH